MAKVTLKICQAGGARVLVKGVFLMMALSLSLSLSACGFHLKGMGEAATATYQSIKVTQGPGVRSDITQALTRQLQSMGVKVVDNLGDAEVALNLQATQLNTSITARDVNGDVSGELLKMVQPFNAQEVATEKEVIDAKATAFRDRSVNAAQAQASNRELQSIERQMATEIAMQVIDRLNRAYAKLQSSPLKLKAQ